MPIFIYMLLLKGESWGTSKIDYGIEYYFRVTFEQLMQCNHNVRFIIFSTWAMYLGFKF